MEEQVKRKKGRPKGLGKESIGSYNGTRTQVDPITGLQKVYTEPIENFELRCDSHFNRLQTVDLLERLGNLEFDIVGELITLYRGHGLNDRSKVELLLKLMDYIYPKKKAVDITQHTDTKIEYISTIVFEEPTKEVYDNQQTN